MSDRNDDMNSNERHVIAAMDNEGETCEVVVRTLEFGSHEITLPRTVRVVRISWAGWVGSCKTVERTLYRLNGWRDGASAYMYPQTEEEMDKY